MVQHKDLFFNIIQPEESGILKQPMLRRIDKVGASQAGAAIRTHLALSAEKLDTIPGLAMGRIHCPVHKVRDWNNIPLDKPLPCAIVAAEDPEMGRFYWLQVFSDRSAVLMASEDSSVGEDHINLMRTMPIAFRLPGKIEMTDGGSFDKPWSLTVRASDSHAEMLISPTGTAEQAQNFLTWDPASYLQAGKLSAMRTVLQAEMIAWGREIANLPWIAGPLEAPICGTFGDDMPAPSTELEGQPYAWPAAAPYTGFSNETYKASTHFIKLAWAYLLDVHCKDIPDMRLEVCAGTPSQERVGGRIQIEGQFLAAPGEDRAETTARVLAAFRRLLSHPDAPEGMMTLVGANLITNTKGASPRRLEPYLVFRGRLGRDVPSAHERLIAHQMFGAWEAAL